MHYYRISVLKTNVSMLSNAASCVFVVSVLGVFAKLRSLLPKPIRMHKRLFIFLVELMVVLYAADSALQQIWLPYLRLVNLLCLFLGEYIKRYNQSFIMLNIPKMARWIHNDAFYTVRWLSSISIFLIMLYVIGFTKLLQSNLAQGDRKHKMVAVNSTDDFFPAHTFNSGGHQSFDVHDLPLVPQERARSRQRKPTPKRKSKARNKSYILLDGESSEC